jgi:predicted lactoylglutathione lyase
MTNQIFISFPVKDLNKSMKYFEQLGYTFDPKFTSGDTACMQLNEYTFTMLLTHKKWSEFTKKPIADAGKTNEVALNTALNSNAEVDAMIEKGLKAGGKEPRATEDYEFMYSRALEDPDGHTWEYFCMDMSKVPQQ